MSRYICVLVGLLLVASPTRSFNRTFFYRTSSFWEEPRFVKPWLSTLEVQLLGGANHRGRNGKGNRSHLTSIYGPENIKALSKASGIPLELPQNPKQIEFNAVADIFESDFNFYQNFTHGFFMHFHFPLVILRVFPSGFVDSDSYVRPSKEYKPSWNQTLSLLSPFLRKSELSLNRTDGAAASDSTLLLGWTYAYEDTCYLDFVDLTFKTGILFPTGKKAHINEIFSLPYGYNGHWAIPFSGDISLGIYDWLTFGYHADILLFFKKNEFLRMRGQHESTTGIVVLGKGEAEVQYGTVWRLGTYAKADHFYDGMSLLMGFTYEQKNKDLVDPFDRALFNLEHVNNDERFQEWNRSIVHFLFEYDFTQWDSQVGTRLGVFYDLEMTGKRVFNISTTGGYLGIDANWCF
jgi:hypothetical protein